MEETALPVADEAKASETPVDVVEQVPEEQKPEETSEQKRVRQLERSLRRALNQRAELKARLSEREERTLSQPQRQESNTDAPSEDEPLQLSRKELNAVIEREARKLAPTIRRQEDEIQRKSAIAEKLERELGKAKFDELASGLDEAFGGLADDKNRPRPVTDAIFEADDPRSVIEYLADPENADEAEAIAKLGPIQVGRAVAKLESKLAQKKAEAKPQASKVADPIEPSKGGGSINVTPRDTDSIDTWVRKERERMAKAGRRT